MWCKNLYWKCNTNKWLFFEIKFSLTCILWIIYDKRIWWCRRDSKLEEKTFFKTRWIVIIVEVSISYIIYKSLSWWLYTYIYSWPVTITGLSIPMFNPCMHSIYFHRFIDCLWLMQKFFLWYLNFKVLSFNFWGPYILCIYISLSFSTIFHTWKLQKKIILFIITNHRYM